MNKVSDVYKERGLRLKKARQVAGLTQGELAKGANCKQEMISRYERGIYDIPADVLVFLHGQYSINTDYVLLNHYPISLVERLIKKKIS